MASVASRKSKEELDALKALDAVNALYQAPAAPIRKVVPAAGKMKTAPKRKQAAKKKKAAKKPADYEERAKKAAFTRFLNKQAQIRDAIMSRESIAKMGTFNPYRNRYLPKEQLKRDAKRVQGACYSYAQPLSENNRQLASIYNKCLNWYDKTQSTDLKSLPKIGRQVIAPLTNASQTFLRGDKDNEVAYILWQDRAAVGKRIRAARAGKNAQKKALKKQKQKT